MEQDKGKSTGGGAKDEKNDHRKFPYSVDGKEYNSETRSLTGAQIKAQIGGLEPGYQLVEEGRDDKPDRVISNEDTVDLDVHPPLHFYIAPPATFGL